MSHVCKLAYHTCIALGLGPRRGLFCFSPASTPRVRVMADNDATWLDTWWFAFCYGSCSLVAALVVVGEVASEVSKVMV